jgi:hypothetical protein
VVIVSRARAGERGLGWTCFAAISKGEEEVLMIPVNVSFAGFSDTGIECIVSVVDTGDDPLEPLTVRQCI